VDTVQGADTPEADLARRITACPPGEAREAEAQLYRLLAPRVRRYGLRHLRDAHAAADLMQHVMTLTIEHLRSGRVREPERVLSFVLGTCRMTVMDQRRTEHRREDLLERCTVAPEDQLLVSRLAAPLAGVQRLDLAAEMSTAPGVQHRLEDIPFDPASGEVLYLARLSLVRQLPEHTTTLRLLAVEPDGTRELGRYAFHHAPWR
jgi:DNA-directed RNA polymerase specialized sigma24 family protein